MKKQVKKYLHLLIIIFLCSCINNKAVKNEIAVDGNAGILEVSHDTTSENYDWLTEYGWNLRDGRHLVDPLIDPMDWIGPKTPIVFFEKFNLPLDSVLYQVRLRKDLFYFLYQTENKDKLYPIGSAFGNVVFDLEFGDNYSYISLHRNGIPYGLQYRVSQQLDPDYPLVGIWGKLPPLFEYRLVNPINCVFYMDIMKEIPEYAVRSGTYLFYMTGDDTFETISSFADGQMRLEIKDERLLILTPLFTLSEDEEGWVAPLIVDRMSFPKTDLVKEEY